jgi:hypothetical protein
MQVCEYTLNDAQMQITNSFSNVTKHNLMTFSAFKNFPVRGLRLGTEANI